MRTVRIQGTYLLETSRLLLCRILGVQLLHGRMCMWPSMRPNRRFGTKTKCRYIFFSHKHIIAGCRASHLRVAYLRRRPDYHGCADVADSWWVTTCAKHNLSARGAGRVDLRRRYSGLSALKHIPDVHAPNAIRLRVITQTEAKIEDGGMLEEEIFHIPANPAPGGSSGPRPAMVLTR